MSTSVTNIQNRLHSGEYGVNIVAFSNEIATPTNPSDLEHSAFTRQSDINEELSRKTRLHKIPVNLLQFTEEDPVVSLSNADLIGLLGCNASEFESSFANTEVVFSVREKKYMQAKTFAVLSEYTKDNTNVYRFVGIDGNLTVILSFLITENQQHVVQYTEGFLEVHETETTVTDAVKYTQQSLTAEQQAQARQNIGAGTSDFSGSYDDLSDKPALGTASEKDVPESGNASANQVVMGDDSRLTDSRNAADVQSWAKAANKPSYTALEVGAIPSSEKGTYGGVATLDASGKIPTSQLPASIDDIIEGYYYNSKWYSDAEHTTEVAGQSGKIYADKSTNKSYRWSGSQFIEISSSLALGETASTAYAGDKGKANADNIAAIQSVMPSGASSNNKLATANDVNIKVDKVVGKGLSTNDYDNTAKSKLNGLANIKTIGSGLNLNNSGQLTANVSVPTKTSDLTNDSNFVSDASYIHTDSNYTSAEKIKLNRIADPGDIAYLQSYNASGILSGMDPEFVKDYVPTYSQNPNLYAGYIFYNSTDDKLYIITDVQNGIYTWRTINTTAVS